MMLSKKMPKGEAIPLGTKRVKTSKRKTPLITQNTIVTAQMFNDIVNETPFTGAVYDLMPNMVDTPHTVDVISTQPAITRLVGVKIMTLTFKSLSKNGKTAYYEGIRTLIQVPVTNFEGPYPSTFTIDGPFAGPRVPMTKEERKAANAAKPKPTQAERVAQMEKRLAAMRAKLEQPVGV